jgi:putative heme-binding domain-containing protein
MALLLLLALAQDPPIRVPDGWTVERAVKPGLVDRPIMAGFDERGRLYVADSAGVNLRFDKLMENPPHRLVRLEDADADGVFETGVVFADKLTFPMGVLAHRGFVYVASPPSLWRFRDVDGDGKADERTELVTKFGSIGNAADVHGPFLGPEGRLWWTDGRHGHNIKRSDGVLMAGKAARVFRCRPDGNDVEVVCGGGMDNPVELDFTDEGEPLVSADLFRSGPRVDSIFYAIEGGVFPYHEVLREFKRTGELLPSVVDLGWVAPSGIRRSRTDGAWYTAQFNTHKLQRHVIERDGAGFRGRNEDFLTCEHPDFHPTDVVEDADGSLLLLDTGGWFRIGCPTSQVDKPNVLGGIWRLRRKDAPRVDDPRGLKLDASAPKAAWLDDPRFAVREMAIDVLPDAPLDGPTPRARRNAVWARTRGGRSVRPALADPDPSVRQAAARACGLERDREATASLIRLLEDPSPPVRREAATALGRLGTKDAVGPLLDALPGADRFLDHALIFALLTIGDDDALRAALRREPAVRRGALIALDQRDALAREELTPCLDPSSPALMQSALWVLSHRPAWSGEIAGLLRGWLAGPPREEIRGAVAAFARDPAVQDLVARALRSPETRPDTRVLLLESLAQAPLDRLPATWTAELRWALDSPEPAVVRQAVATLKATAILEYSAALLDLARDAGRDEELRVEAAAAARPTSLDEPLLRLLLGAVSPAKPALLRMSAALALGHAATPESLLPTLASAGPMELPRLLAAFERSKNALTGRKLLAALEKSSALESLPADVVRRALAAQPDEVRAAAAPLLKRLEGDVDAQRARLAELEPLLAGGDAARGRDVFNGRTAACTSCHAVGPIGGRVGPDLTKIGGIRAPKDLLESIVFPSLSFVRGYEPAAIRTKDGSVLDGVVVRESADAVTLVQADRTERRVPRASIAELRQGRLSIMPQGLDRQLSAQELRDLVAYLVSLR